MMTVKFNHAEVTKALRSAGRHTPDAANRAVNKTLTPTRQAASVATRRIRKLPARVVKRQLHIRKANRAAKGGAIVAKGAPISLKHYGAKQVWPRGFGGSGRRRGGVNRRGQRARPLGVRVQVVPGRKQVLRHAFFGPNGHVYQRDSYGPGSGRGPISILLGPSMPVTLLKRHVLAAMNTKVTETLPRHLLHELNRELKRRRLR